MPILRILSFITADVGQKGAEFVCRIQMQFVQRTGCRNIEQLTVIYGVVMAFTCVIDDDTVKLQSFCHINRDDHDAFDLLLGMLIDERTVDHCGESALHHFCFGSVFLGCRCAAASLK